MRRLAALLLLLAMPAVAQAPGGETAQAPKDAAAQKCARYGAAWAEAVLRFGRDGLGAGFLAAHDHFLASGCRSRAAICPRSEAELALANAMTVAAMNAGMASTFVPFRCGASAP